MKYVREHIDEKFSEESDPIYDLGIGKKHKIIQWINYINTTRRQNYDNLIKHFRINPNGTIDVGINYKTTYTKQYIANNIAIVQPSLIIRGNIITELPDFIKFNVCYGDCMLNVSKLKNLKGVPRIIYGSFCCNYNHDLKSLEFMPKIVYGNVYMYGCGTKFTSQEIRNRCKVYGNVETKL